jgi:HEAT repeat protein
MVKDHGYTYICGCGTVTDRRDDKIFRLGYGDSVDKWLPLMKSSDQLDREGAAQALGWLAKTKEDKDKAVPVLIEALSDNAMEVRRDSAESLGRIGDSRAKESLEKIAKGDKDDWVREVAEESVGLIEVKIASDKLANGDKTAIAEFSKALDHKWFLVRRTAVEFLAKGGSEAVEPLITALKNDDSEVRSNAAKILAEIGDKQALEPLKSALADEKDEDVKKALSEAIEKLGK